jgi:hypothetical protein
MKRLVFLGIVFLLTILTGFVSPNVYGASNNPDNINGLRHRVDALEALAKEMWQTINQQTQQINQLLEMINNQTAHMKVAVLKDGEGNVIGTYIGEFLISSKGYRFSIDRRTGKVPMSIFSSGIGSMLFPTDNCTGTSFLVSISESYTLPLGGTSYGIGEPGMVVSDSYGNIYFINKSATESELPIIKSSFSNMSPFSNGCISSSWYLQSEISLKKGYELTPNDPAITGIEASYPLPITIEVE